MITCVVSVRDSAMGAFAAPMAFPTTAVAVRAFTQQVNSGDANSQLVQSPEDFEIWHVANFDDVTGQFMLPEEGAPVCLARGKDLKR